MTDLSHDTERVADQVLSILKPLLTSPTDQCKRSISAKLRAANPPAKVLASTINIFSKLLSDAYLTQNAKLSQCRNCLRELVSHLFTTPLLSRNILYEAIDGNTASILEPHRKWLADKRRVQTRLWFTQTRFNLFREESEGYAKVTLLLWNCTLSMSSSKPSTIFEALLSLIGQFSLDTNRVIEVVLSAAAEKVQESITSTGGLPIVHRIPEPFAHILNQFPQDHVHAVIGAMLRAYQEPFFLDSEAITDTYSSEIDTKAAKSLVSLVSVMISEGKMKVSDVLGYLSPMENSDFTTRFRQYENDVMELAENVNALRMASQPTGDDLKNPRPKHGGSDRDVFGQYKLMERGPLHSFSSQKIDFIITLFGLCRSKDALTAILGLSLDGEHVDVAAHPTITKTLFGVAEALLNPLLHSQFPSLYAENRYVSEAIRKLGGREKGYDVPIENIEEFLSDEENGPGAVVRQILAVLGPSTRASIRLLQALCRIFKGRSSKHVVSIMKEVVLPSSALVQSNVALADAIWGVLKEWPHSLRWELYDHLDKVVSGTCVAYNLVSSRASYETRYILKRLTADNQKQHMLTMAKISHGQAMAAFSATLDRVQGYPADIVTISPVIEACRKCTDLSIDVLLYLVLNRMADSRRSRLKEDGINPAQWYATLSLFLGLCLRKLSVAPQHVDAVLQFLYTKLVEDDEPLLIIALSDIIKCVADMEVDINLSAKQIASHGGGPVLLDVVSSPWSKLQADVQMCGTVSDVRSERERTSATSALLEAFDRTGIHSFVGVAIARLTHDAVYHETIRSMPLKLGANIVDMARTSLLQLSGFINARLSDSKRDEELRERIWRPLRAVGIAEMVCNMHVPISSAAALMGPELDFIAELAIREPFASTGSLSNQVKSDTKVSTLDSAAHSADAPEGRNDPNHRSPKEGARDKAVRGPENEEVSQDGSRSHLSDIIHKRVRGTISKSMLTLFWFSKLSDIAVPVDIYDSEQKRFSMIQNLWDKEVEAFRPRSHGETDRLRRLDLELRRIREYVQKLEAERNAVTKRMSLVMKTVEEQRGKLCAGADKKSRHERMEATYFFLQECILPRCMLSRPDALFCSKFVQLLLDLDVPAVYFAEYYEALLGLVPVVLRSCSENESLCLSFLVKEILVTLEGWRSNRNTFETEASTAKQHGFRDKTSTQKPTPLKHWQFCQWLFNIHENLRNRLSALLCSDEYLYARNSLSLLNVVAEVFPKVSEHCTKIETCVQTLTSSDLADIRLTATGVLARLRAGKARRLPKHIFTLKPVGGGGGGGSQPTKIILKRESGLPSQVRSAGGSDSKTRASDRDQKTDSNTKELRDERNSSLQQSSQSEPQSNSAVKPVETGQSSDKSPSCMQDRYDQPIPVIVSNLNGNVTEPLPHTSMKRDPGRPLNPNAKEFVPGEQNCKREGNFHSGKRSRSFDGDPRPGTSWKDGARPTGDRRSKPGNEMAPPLKKARGEDLPSLTDRDGDGKTSSDNVSRKHNLTGRGQSPDVTSSKRGAQKAERGTLGPSKGQVTTKETGIQARGKKIDLAPSDYKKQGGLVDVTEKVSSRGGSVGEGKEKMTTPSPTAGGRDGGPSRSPSNGRSSPPGRNENVTRQAFQNGKDYVPSKGSGGDRYREGTGGRGMRRDTQGGAGSRDVSQVRETTRESSGREQSGVRRREPIGYDYGGSGERRAITPGGEFRRTASESRLGDGLGAGDYFHSREYPGDGHGTKRRREGGPMRASYGYESDGRRSSRPRNDSDYERTRDEGKQGPDRRFNGNSPSRDGGAIAHNPNWMDGRWHGDGHENTRRQGNEEHTGWQKRGEREFDNAARGMRRDDRESYYERPDRFGEGPPRRDDRRRPSRGRPVRRRMGR